MGRVDGKVIIVTGAASGIGRADAVLLSQEGATVVVTDINEAGSRETVTMLAREGLFLTLDVTSETQWADAFATVEARFGRVDCLVNNAGLAIISTIEDCTLDQWHKAQHVNADSVFLGCKYAIRSMRKTGGGSIVNMSSISALVGESFVVSYAGAKGAVRSLSKAVAVHCAQNSLKIRCNAIFPSGIDTPMTHAFFADFSERDAQEAQLASAVTPMGVPNDIAFMVLYLCSDESRFVSGAEMVIDNTITSTGGFVPA